MSSQLTDLNDLLRYITVFNSESAYKQLFMSLYPVLKKFSYTLVKSQELAEEVASDVMMKIWLAKEQLSDIKNIKVYALIMARNISLNIIKQQSKREFISLDDIQIELFLDTHSPEQILINKEIKNKLEFIIQSLPNRCKLVFKLVKEDGLSYKETAEILNISIKTVDAHLVTAIKKITSALKVEFNLN
jgi:RNA polymerase sigma-70 factor (ECF subfamily)